MARLNIFGTFADNFISFAGGNPGALNTLFELQKEAKDRTALFLLTLDRMELYESHLYMLWNDCCNRDIKKVIKILELYEREIITQQDIDERIKNVGYGRNFDDLIKESEEIKKMNSEMLKVSSKSNPNAVAGAIAGLITEDKKTELQAIGAGAINQTVKAIAIARGFVAPLGIDLITIPAFATVVVEDQDRTGMKFIVKGIK